MHQARIRQTSRIRRQTSRNLLFAAMVSAPLSISFCAGLLGSAATFAQDSQHQNAQSRAVPGTGQGREIPGAFTGNAAAPEDSDVVILNSRAFSIPIKIDASGQLPTEIQLFVLSSEDKQWRLIERKPASEREFQYVGNVDGPLWFTTRTIDAQGHAEPTGPLEPGLKVLVDTAQPVIQLEHDADAEGRVTGRLRVSDATPIKKLRIDFATDVKLAWRSLDEAAIDQNGRFSFLPNEDWTQLSMQIVVSDSAGNQSVETAWITRPRIAAAATQRLASTPSGQSTDTLAAGYRTPAVAQTAPLPAHLSPPAVTRHQQFATGPLTTNQQNATQRFAPTQAQIYPAGTELNLNAAGSGADGRNLSPETAAYENPADGYRGLVPAAARPAIDPAIRPITERSLLDARGQSSSPRGSAAEVLPTPGGRNQYGPQTNSQTIPRTAIPTPFGGQPTSNLQTSPAETLYRERQSVKRVDPQYSSAPVRYSNSQKFSLDYELEAVGSSGLDAVELWGTVDQGRTWVHWGVDPDNASPFDIETEDDGLFGFRIVVQGRNGLRSPRPLPGESPDILVGVDRSVPQTQITNVRYGVGDRVGSLVIQYDCDDNNLSERPIALSFSDTPDGPWTTIAAGLRNDGDYVWPADPQLPRQIFLRIDVTDQAGNVGTHIVDRPIDSQGLAPRARIRSFRALGNESAANAPNRGGSPLDAESAGRSATRNYPTAAFK